MKVIILAGGFATRLWPITDKRAKPLMYLNGQPIISHLVDRISSNDEIIISTNKVFELDFKEWRKKYPERNIKIFIEDSGADDFKKGALGATALVIQEEKIKDNLVLLAGDNYFGFDLEVFKQQFNNNPLLAVYDVGSKDEARKYGVVMVEGEKVSAFAEKPLNPESTLVSTGCYIIPQRNLRDIIDYAKKQNDDLGGVFEYLLTKDEIINYYSFKEEWFDIGSFSSYITAHKYLQGKRNIIAENSFLDKNTVLSKTVFLGENCVIKNSIIEDSVIMDNCVIVNCVIRGSIIDSNSHLDGIDINYKMLREGTVI